MIRPLIFGTCYVDTSEKRDVVTLWARLMTKLNPDIPLLLVDSASPFNPAVFLNEAPEIKARDDFTIFSFGDNIGHLSAGGRDGWGRAFCQGLGLARSWNRTDVAYIDADMLLARPVMPIMKKMAGAGVRVACPLDMTYQFVENGIVFAELDYLREIEFTRKYNWEHSPTPDCAETFPERRFEKIVESELFLLPLRGLRNDFDRVNVENVGAWPYGIDYITHCKDPRVYQRFLEVNGIEL